jgi:hypothetical protein
VDDDPPGQLVSKQPSRSDDERHEQDAYERTVDDSCPHEAVLSTPKMLTLRNGKPRTAQTTTIARPGPRNAQQAVAGGEGDQP